jgi:alpha-mannosidase
MLVRDKLHRAKSRRIVAPLGVLIDEAERQTLICAEGFAYHRRVGERFLDTLLLVQGETRRRFVLHLGLDVPAPVSGARARLIQPTLLNVVPKGTSPPIGWLVHAAPKDLLVTQLQVCRRPDGRLAALVRVIQTQPQTCKAKLRFLRDIAGAVLVDGPPQPLMELGLEELDSMRSRHRTDLQFEGDMVTLAMPSHGVVDVLVVFGTSRGDA